MIQHRARLMDRHALGLEPVFPGLHVVSGSGSPGAGLLTFTSRLEMQLNCPLLLKLRFLWPWFYGCAGMETLGVCVSVCLSVCECVTVCECV